MNCKEDTSLFTEFTKIIATLEQEFEGVEAACVGKGPVTLGKLQDCSL